MSTVTSTPPPQFEPRKAIKGGEWVVSIQLEIDGTPTGSPLELRYVDTYVAGEKKNSIGTAADFGHLISRALYERAVQLRPGRKSRK